MTQHGAPSSARYPRHQPHTVEWPTLALLALCLGLWVAALALAPIIGLWLAVPVLVFTLVLHSSLTHEVVHGHPLPSRRASEALMHVNPGIFVPFLRFRDTHLAHHQDARLTDPYDDPESNYLDPAHWRRLPPALRVLRRFNNTLAGRMLIGPALGQACFMAGDVALIRKGDRQVLLAWVLHLPSVVLVLWIVSQSAVPIWLYLLCAYAALSVLKIRTFLEHQAHTRAQGRTVIIEDRGPLAFLFLNNNLHVVHHMHPRVPWYRLPALYAANKARYLARNDGYVYASYREIFRRYFLTSKDPVAHPLWPSAGD